MPQYGVIDMKNSNSQEGFTLIEVIIALGVLSIGMLSVMVMQVTGIRGNATANTITTESNWASDRVEQLLALDYDDALLDDGDNDGVPGLDDTTVATADGNATSPDLNYTIFWNIAHYMTPYATPTDSTVKCIRVTVQHNSAGIPNQVVMNYYKQKIF